MARALILGLALLVLLPIGGVIWLALGETTGIWQHLLTTTLPAYAANSLVLTGLTGLLAAAIGTACAYAIATWQFPLSRFLGSALLLPLAMPAWISAFALVELLDYSGPVQGALRNLMGWTSPQDFAFPEIRSMGAAILALSLSLYPYVYLIARAAFREQSAEMSEIAATLGCSPARRFWRVALPLARPAIVAGMMIVMMETLSDLGTVTTFAVPTLTVGIFSTWLEARDVAAAAQLALLVLIVILSLVLIERAARRRLRYWRPVRTSRPQEPRALTGWRAWLATSLCALPVLLGFCVPFLVVLDLALGARAEWLDPNLGRAVRHTLVVSSATALVTVGLAALMVSLLGLRQNAALRRFLPLTMAGYAVPGAVLALGLLTPLAAFDNALADAIQNLTGQNPGLILTGTGFLLVLAFSIRFFAVPVGALEASHNRMSPNLPAAARSLGLAPLGVLRQIELPQMRGTILTVLLLVFVDCVKELPATLFLRPFNFDTLATRVFEASSLERMGQAAPAALLVTLVSLVAVALLARAR